MSGTTTVRRPQLLHLIQGFDFPDYVKVEYPKWVKNAEGKDVIVQTPLEESQAKKGAKPASEVLPSAEESEAEMAALEARMEQLRKAKTATASSPAVKHVDKPLVEATNEPEPPPAPKPQVVFKPSEKPAPAVKP